MRAPITIETIVRAPIATVWDCWTKPEHITHWAFASADWEAPEAENDVRTGGTFKTVMAAKDGSARFDFVGIYTDVKMHEMIAYDIADGRHVTVAFSETADGVRITETFDPENENAPERQRAGWQAILENFKKYAETGV